MPQAILVGFLQRNPKTKVWERPEIARVPMAKFPFFVYYLGDVYIYGTPPERQIDLATGKPDLFARYEKTKLTLEFVHA